MGGIGAAAIFTMQASMSVSLARTAIRVFSLFLSLTNQSAKLGLRLFLIHMFNAQLKQLVK